MTIDVCALKVHRRDATEADLPAIVSIYNETIPSWTVTVDNETVTVPGRMPWFHKHNPERRPLWVAEHEGQIAGWLSFQPFNPRPAYHATSEISLYIAKPFLRQGIGTQLLRDAIDRGPAMGYHRLMGLIMANNTRALQFFAGFGFQQWGRLPHVLEFNGRECDLVIVGRRAA